MTVTLSKLPFSEEDRHTIKALRYKQQHFTAGKLLKEYPKFLTVRYWSRDGFDKFVSADRRAVSGSLQTVEHVDAGVSLVQSG